MCVRGNGDIKEGFLAPFGNNKIIDLDSVDNIGGLRLIPVGINKEVCGYNKVAFAIEAIKINIFGSAIDINTYGISKMITIFGKEFKVLIVCYSFSVENITLTHDFAFFMVVPVPIGVAYIIMSIFRECNIIEWCLTPFGNNKIIDLDRVDAINGLLGRYYGFLGGYYGFLGRYYGLLGGYYGLLGGYYGFISLCYGLNEEFNGINIINVFIKQAAVVINI